MRVRLVQIDGKLPNLALMKLSSWYKSNGSEVVFSRQTNRQLFDLEFDVIYGSAIFGFSKPVIDNFKREFPEAILGGTGVDLGRTIEQHIGMEWEHYDYSIYPDYKFSLGFTQQIGRAHV